MATVINKENGSLIFNPKHLLLKSKNKKFRFKIVEA